MWIFVEPIGVVRSHISSQSMEICRDSTVGELINVLNLPAKLNVIALADGRRLSMNEKVKEGASIKIVSLVLGG